MNNFPRFMLFVFVVVCVMYTSYSFMTSGLNAVKAQEVAQVSVTQQKKVMINMAHLRRDAKKANTNIVYCAYMAHEMFVKGMTTEKRATQVYNSCVVDEVQKFTSVYGEEYLDRINHDLILD